MPCLNKPHKTPNFLFNNKIEQIKKANSGYKMI